MNAILYSEGAVLVKDAAFILRLEKNGFGARRLYPMVVPTASKTTFACQTMVTDSEDTALENNSPLSPLLLLDEEVGVRVNDAAESFDVHFTYVHYLAGFLSPAQRLYNNQQRI